MKEEKILGFMPVFDEKNRVWKAYRSIQKKLRWVYVGKDKSLAEAKIRAWCKKYGFHGGKRAITEPRRIKWLEDRIEVLEKQLREGAVVPAETSIAWTETKIEQWPDEPEKQEKQEPICGFSILQIQSRGKLYWYALRKFANTKQHKIYLKKELDRATAEAKIRKYCQLHNLMLDKA